MRRVAAVTVFEARGRDGLPKFGAHIVAIMPDAASRDRAIESLNRSRAYGKHVLAKPVTKRRRRRRPTARAFAASAARSRSASGVGTASFSATT
jgi:hypothetical protein